LINGLQPSWFGAAPSPLFRKSSGETINAAYIKVALAKFLVLFFPGKKVWIVVLGLISILLPSPKMELAGFSLSQTAGRRSSEGVI
jgi:hypothetical protein